LNVYINLFGCFFITNNLNASSWINRINSLYLDHKVQYSTVCISTDLPYWKLKMRLLVYIWPCIM